MKIRFYLVILLLISINIYVETCFKEINVLLSKTEIIYKTKVLNFERDNFNVLHLLNVDVLDGIIYLSLRKKLLIKIFVHIGYS